MRQQKKFRPWIKIFPLFSLFVLQEWSVAELTLSLSSIKFNTCIQPTGRKYSWMTIESCCCVSNIYSINKQISSTLLFTRLIVSGSLSYPAEAGVGFQLNENGIAIANIYKSLYSILFAKLYVKSDCNFSYCILSWEKSFGSYSAVF